MEKSYHHIIHNEEDIRQFAKIFRIEANHQAMCLYLTMRRKYYPDLSHGTTIINRLTVTGGDNFEQKLYQNILRLETPIGSYMDKDKIVPNDALALYVLVEPKDTITAMSRILSKCVEAFSNNERLPNAYTLYRDEIPKVSASHLKYKQIDLDTKIPDQVRQVDYLLTQLQLNILICVETRGGFHIVYNNNTSKETNRLLYEFKQSTAFQKNDINGKQVTDHWFSITKEPNIIMPGTYQGNFPTSITTLSAWLESHHAD